MIQDRNYTFGKALRAVLVVAMMSLMGGNTLAQGSSTGTGVVVKGNVYGGGNAADVGADATVNISAGTIGESTVDDEHGNVFGGGKGQVTIVVGKVEVNIGKKVVVENNVPTVTYPDKGNVMGNVYGGSALGAVNATKANDWDKDHLDRISATSGKTTEVNIYTGTVNGNVYGGGRGALAKGTEGQTDYEAPVAARSFGTVTVKIGDVTVDKTLKVEGSVYGGSDVNGILESDVSVDVVRGTIGKSTTEGENTTIEGGNVHGGGYGQPTLVKGDVTVNIGERTGTSPDYTYSGAATILGDVYGGSAKGNVNAIWNDSEGKCEVTPFTGTPTSKTMMETKVNLYGGTVNGDVYGGGLGDNTTDAEIAANVYGPVTVTVEGGTARNVFGCNNLYGSPQQDVVVNIDGGSISVDVFGGGHEADALKQITVNVTGGTVTGDVYGGGALASTNTANWDATNSKLLYFAVEGLTDETSSVTGYYTLSNGVYTLITDKNAKAASGTTYYALYNTTVNLTGGIIGNAYGGGLGDADTPAYVYGDVKVNVNGTAFTQTNESYKNADESLIPKTGRVFGCNNINGSPKSNVTVHVFKTVGLKEDGTINNDKPDNSSVTEPELRKYELAAVYGGGNLAPYEPVKAESESTADTDDSYDDTIASTEVIVDGCNLTSIKQVYGGGNAASTPATKVTINGSYEIEEVFGGGNGKDKISSSTNNPGAHVGFKAYTTDEEKATSKYGYGVARVNIDGGIIHSVYGGSNTKGNVRKVAVAMLDQTSEEDCFEVDEAYGGGKSAEMDGKAILSLGCIPGVGSVYGGARAASVHNDVVLTITNGTYTNVFGGNNEKGTIEGSITVNIEETGCRPIHITNLYGGGNLAPYTTPNGKDGPTINVRSCTSIDNVFGGGYGSSAIVTGDTHVNINMVKGRWAGQTVYGETVLDQLGTIGHVYGGGYGANVEGDTYVNIGTAGTVDFVTEPTYLGSGKYTYNSTTKLYEGVTVEGANITGDVFGGGFGAETNVTGTAYVNIGEKVETTSGENTTITYVAHDASTTGNFGGDIYGGSALGTVNNTQVNLYAGKVSGNVFGGGMGQLAKPADNSDPEHPVPAVEAQSATITNKAEVNLYEANANAIYGGCNANGTAGTTKVTLIGGQVGTTTTSANVFGGGFGHNTYVSGDVLVNVGESNQTTGGTTIYGDIYGGSAQGYVNAEMVSTTSGGNTTTSIQYNSSNTTTVNLNKGIIYGDAYGGGLGQKKGFNNATSDVAAEVGGDVFVNVNGAAFKISNYDDAGYTDVVKSGRVFGCNNLYGSPKGNVTVTVNKTVGLDGSGQLKTTHTKGEYEIAAVYGGGNLADYTAATGKKTNVIINGCEDTSIQYVYGGGNAAAVPETDVDINEAFELGYVFGGGNGKDKYKDDNGWETNPGANVNGNVNTILAGGTIHEAFGGSNEKGAISGSVSITTDTNPDCDLSLGKLYGAGKNADIEGDLIMTLGCMPGDENPTEEVYGGAENANVKGNVELTITSGTFRKVFGGNNTSGAIFGHIKLNIEETGCRPIKIDELYLGGFNAPYSVYGYYEDGTISGTDKPLYKPIESASDNTHTAKYFGNGTSTDHTKAPYDDPELNIISCTRIGKVFGGGLGTDAVIYGNPVVNINQIYGIKADGSGGYTAKATTLGEIGGQYTLDGETVDGGVFGGGNQAPVVGNTTINIGTKAKVEMISLAKVHAVEGDPEYVVNTAADQQPMVYQKETVLGANITGNVYGGGNQAEITGNTLVNICTEDGTTSVAEGTAKVTIAGDVFGAGKGLDTDVKSALVKGNSYVYMGGGWVKATIYGGGELSSVGDFTYDTDNIITGINNETTNSTTNEKEAPTGTATVNIFAGKVGPDNMTMPTFDGHVFGAGKGITGATSGTDGNALIPKLNFVNKTEVTISGTAFVMGSVYGGSENGHVRGNTLVNIQGGQIGCGQGETAAYAESAFINPTDPDTPVTTTNALKACASWQYDTEGKPYDPFHGTDGYNSEGGATVADANDGHTFYGNVFGGGSGYFPYAAGKWLESAGSVGGNTVVNISAGHILSSVYGGNEMTNVEGSCTINMSGGTVGVPRTKTQIENHPVIGNLFGAGKGDKRVLFNTLTNVASTSVNITGGIVYGSVFGGGEDGHILGDATTKIEEDKANNKTITIGTTGESGADGNVFGGGRGSVTSLTAGVVRGNVGLTIKSGTILGSVYGGGRLAAVGTYLVKTDNSNYGKLLDDDATKHGNITVTVNDGTIGTASSTGISGNIYGGSKGTTTDFRLGIARSTTINMTGGIAYASVYGGGELAQVVGSHTAKNDKNENISVGTEINISGGFIGISGQGRDIWGNVYGGGKGNTTQPEAGLIKTNTLIKIENGISGSTTTTPTIYHNIYGGGAYGSVGTITYGSATYIPGKTDAVSNMPTEWAENTGKAEVYVYGGTIGVNGKENGMVFGSSRGDVDTPGTDGVDPNDHLAWVYNTNVVIGGEGKNPSIKGSVYGSGENGHVFNNTNVEIHNGTIGITTNDDLGGPNYRLRGNVYGGGCGEDYYPNTEDFNPLAGIVLGTANVTIDGGQVVHNVYGAGALGSAGGKTTVTISDDAIIGVNGSAGGSVFGAARGKEGVTIVGSNLANSLETEVKIQGHSTDNTKPGAQIWGSVYGGGEAGNVKQNVKVSMTGGVVAKDVYGGGALADTQTSNWNTTTDDWADGKVDSDGKTTYKTTVNLLGGIINGDAYGGGLGRMEVKSGETVTTEGIEAKVYGDVNVNLGSSENGSSATAFWIDHYEDNSETTINESTIVKSGRVFGCNNLNGSPLGNVTVTVWKTVAGSNTRTPAGTDGKAPMTVSNSTDYEVAAVYGGGNLADYTATGKKTHVVINGCSDTSIEYVYGGGNAAAVRETDVDINAAYEIAYVFGGGNGKDPYTLDGTTWIANPGANVSGDANTVLAGGTIHEAFGGSNEKGTISGSVSITTDTNPDCALRLGKLYGAGKNADIEGDLIVTLGCMPGDENPTEEVYGGAENANVKGDVELTITSGTFRKVFGGNNTSGAIFGHIKLNIEETGCRPIKIDELYLGGYNAPYSVYGYYQDGTIDGTDKPKYVARQSASDTHTAVYFGDNSENDHTKAPYADPELNIISCTRIGKVFGGGLGSTAVIYGNPIVNINQIYGIMSDGNGGYTAKATTLGEIGGQYTLDGETVDGGVFGGGNQASVIGNTTVNIGTLTEVAPITTPVGQTANDNNRYNVLGANIVSNVYGGGQLADVGQYDVDNDHVDVAGNTYVNIGAKYNTTWESVAEGTSKVLIAGNVFGGGEGEAAESGAGAFKCAKAIVTGETNIHIGNGTVNGTVYGGGEVGRVEGNSVVAVGIGAGNTTPASAPIILGDVFGAGKGKKTHGYSALLRGNPTVTIEGDAKVRGSVYGGGEIASVGKYNVKKGDNNPVGAPDDVLVGMPYSLANSGSGYCTVIVQGNAEIGPETEMQMKKVGGPDDTGHVFGAGKGVLPYDGYGVTADDWISDPWRVSINDQKDIFNSTNYTNYEKEYFKYIETLALATETNVTIGGNAFVKGSVYGGSMNGHVQHDTHVNIAGGQIGQGAGVTKGRYSTEDWASTSLAECPHWDYDASSGAPYDPLATTSGNYDYGNYGFVPAVDRKIDSDGGRPEAKDGHTYYGNVFGGGSGSIPYAPGLWHRGAGSVGGDTYVTITGGHILTSVYGGNEHTDVGTYEKDENGQPTTTPAANNARGKCTVNMTGGTVGVPRTDTEKQEHPVVGNIFGAGKGDQRIFFNTWTNVINTEVNISGDAHIFGSIFGGGEDGHVIGDAETNIGNVTIKTGKNSGVEITKDVENNGLIIGTTGTSYNDGNVFGGGRGFSGEAQTAGTVGGNARVNINAGSVYGSVYGGGRLASVGTMFEFPTKENGGPNPAYGQFKEDSGSNTYGHVTINISGGTIGKDYSTTTPLPDGIEHSGNVFGGSMGRLNLLNGTRNPIWPKMAQVKETNVNIYGTAVVRRSVYGGGELGTVRENAYVTIGGYKTADADNDGNVAVTSSNSDSPTVMRDVYGGGYGSEDMNYTIFTIPELKSATADPTNPASYESHTYAFTPMQFAGCVGKNTYVNIAGGYIRKSVYGGGEMASVGVIDYRASTTKPTADEVTIGPIDGTTYYYDNMVKHGDPATGFALSWPYKFNYVDGYPGATHVKVSGGRLGLKTGDTDTGFDDNGDVYGAGKGQAGDFKDYLFCANVGSTDVKIAYTSTPEAYTGTGDLVAGAVYGGGEDGHVMGDTKMTILGGLIYHSVYGGGSGKGTYQGRLLKIGATEESATASDYYNREVYSITAGKVFGNTEVNMSGGYVVRNIYGGGNMGSVGKGNYAGGSDDYSTDGYGEKVNNLWSNTDFLGSGKCTVKITGGTIGYIDTTTPSNSMYPYNSPASLPYGNVFGGCRGEAAPDLDVTPSYLYSPEFFMGYANETEVTIDGSTTKILGSVYGGGMDGHVRRDASVTIKGGEIGKTFDATSTLGNDPNNIQWLARGNVYGAGSGIGEYNASVIQYSSSYTGTQLTGTGKSTSAGSVTGSTTVDIQGGTIHRNVYGGGSLASVGAPKIGQDYFEYRKGDTTEGHGVGKQTLNEVVISGGNIGDTNSYDANGNYVYGGRVFGGSRGDASLDATKFSTSMFTSVTVNANATPAKSPVIYGSVFGGGEVGIVKGSVDVTLNGGTVEHDVYGGGALANTNTETSSTVPYTTTVNLLGGTISGDAYGGGLGQKTGFNSATSDIAAVVYGDINVKLGKEDGSSATAFNVTKYTDAGHVGIVKSGRVFGCNNLMGSPQGDVRVTVYKTVEGNTPKTASGDLKSSDASKHKYHVAAVYGGGNLADFTTAGKKAYVRIETCDVSIRDVYGGGNAAEVPGTDVLVRGAYEIQEVFGGGNGKDPYTNGTDWIDNPGANIGNATNPGNATTLLTGGFIHEAYGGSNEQGTIFGSVSIDMGVGSSADHTDGICTLDVEKLVGAGKNADVNGDLIMIMGCKPSTKTPLLYAGADNANVKGNVELTITSGNFGKVFGGNNEGGAIFGHIKLNIEETGGCDTPITIDELYLGGNNAAYSRFGYYIKTNDEYGAPGETPVLTEGRLTFMPRTSADDPHKVVKTYNRADNSWTVYSGTGTDVFTPYDEPVLNVVSCTRIDQVFGGGYGEGGTMYANPTVNINMIPGHFANDNTVGVPAVMTAKAINASDNPQNLGIIGDVFGGGNAAAVMGNPTVNIGTATTVKLHLSYDKTKIDATHDGYEYSADQTVLGAYIHGNVYGGGNLADVGYLHDDTKNPDPNAVYCNTNVNICAKEVTENSETIWQSVEAGSGGVTIAGDVFGGGKGKENTFKCEKAMIVGNTNVRIGNGTMRGDVFGGGEVGRVEQNTSVTVGLTSGTSAPVINGNVFGAGAGKKTHGYSALVRGNATVIVQADASVGGSVYGGGEIATAGRYRIENDLPVETTGGGLCTVTVQGSAEVTGNVFGAGMGVTPAYNQTDYKNFKSMVTAANKPSGSEGDTWDYYVDEDTQTKNENFVWKYYKTEADYLKFLQTLALASNTVVTIDGNAKVKKNVYGGSESGFVQDHTQVTTQGSCVIGTKTTGDNPTVTDGNVFGGGKGLVSFAEAGLVKGTTTLYINNGTMYGNVYGGGELGSVGKYTVSADMRTFTWGDPYNNTGVCNVNIAGGTIGSGAAMSSDGTYANGNVFGAGKGKEDTFWCEKGVVYKANVNVTAGNVKGNVYGGGEVGRVETDAVVKIGPDTGNAEPTIEGNVFGGGAGVKTHGYSALVRGNTYVTVQSKAKVGHNVYGGGQIAAVGKYYLVDAQYKQDHPESNLEIGMPYSLVSDELGICNVTIKGNAAITGSVFGGGKGKEPENYTFADNTNRPKRMMSYNTALFTEDNHSIWEFADANEKYVWEYFDTKPKYQTFLETLGLTTQSVVKVDGSAQVNGSVYGGSESGFVQHNTSVTIAGGTIGTGSAGGNVFGGGLGLATFAEAGRVRGNATVTINNGTVKGNVYGGGQLGDVGTIVKSADYNYKWTNEANPGTNYEWNSTGVCNVTINGGTIGTGVAVSDDGTYANGNVYGAGKGLEDTWWCEKAMAYKTNVTITDGTIKGTVYGGGQVGRVENDATVTIGTANENVTGSKPNIIGNVFGAGAGVMTHGYSALVRGDATVTVQGVALVGGSVYGGGEIASVGRFEVPAGLPTKPLSGGKCTVTIQDHAKIGADGTGHNVFGACKGVTPAFVADGVNRSKSMQLATNAPSDASLWSPYEDDPTYIWRYYPDAAAYRDFLETLALTSHPIVTIAEDATVNGSVFGGGERGITLGSVEVNMNGGTVTEDVYGGGSLADTNKGNWETSTNTWADDTNTSTTYTTAVNLHNGTINRNVYGGGLGDATTAALVYGDVTVELNKTTASDNCVVKGSVFGCNNVNGTPKGHTKVHVFKTVSAGHSHGYDVTSVFGGGKSADYVPADARQSAEVIIEGCNLTSIQEVYGGGYGASTPGTDVLINGTKIIDKVFGGGYGKTEEGEPKNPGANVGFRTDGTPYGIGVVDGNVVDDKTKIAIIQLKAGKVNSVFGGSNSLGDIRNGASITTLTSDETGATIDPCDILEVGELYGGGNEAVMEGGAEIVLRCMPDSWIGEVYAGARKADVGNDVSLTITSGKFEHVYGGNKSDGKIEGYVEVNIEECPTCGTPVIIGELYGGGNEAPYTLPASYGADYQSPRVNVRAFTSIGTIYGGGRGENAVVNGNPTVSINVGLVDGGGQDYDGETKTLDGKPVQLYPHEKNKIGVIGNVFGGGNAAKVNGNTNVLIGTESYVKLERIVADETDVSNYYTRSGDGTTASPYVYTKASGKAKANTIYYLPVLGVDIRGNVYGGGNAAEVTGNTNVVIGKEAPATSTGGGESGGGSEPSNP